MYCLFNHDLLQVPDYYDLIENPICLSRIKEKTLYLQYDTCEEFVDDILTLLDNCFSYNLVRLVLRIFIPI